MGMKENILGNLKSKAIEIKESRDIRVAEQRELKSNIEAEYKKAYKEERIKKARMDAKADVNSGGKLMKFIKGINLGNKNLNSQGDYPKHRTVPVSYTHSDETRKKLSIGNKNRKNPFEL